jgi:hypothetical protein
LITIKGWFELARLDKIRCCLRLLDILLSKDIKYLFITIGDFEATDPRDHVYSLLGFLKTEIVPDYCKSLAAVYSNYIDLYIRSTQSLKFLISAGNRRFDYNSSIGLPS